MQKTYKELAEIFDKYDIKGTTDQMIDDLEQDYRAMPPEVELNKAPTLLTVLGAGGVRLRKHDMDSLCKRCVLL